MLRLRARNISIIEPVTVSKKSQIMPSSINFQGIIHPCQISFESLYVCLVFVFLDRLSSSDRPVELLLSSADIPLLR